MLQPADRDDDELAAFVQVGDRRPRRPRFELGFPDHSSRRLVERAELPAAAGGWRPHVDLIPLADEQQRFRHERRRAHGLPERRQMEILQQGMIARTVGGGTTGPVTYFLTTSIASARSSGVKSIRSSIVTPWRSKAGGLVGNGCVGDAFSPGTVDAGTGRSSIGHTGLPVTRSSTYANDCLVTCTTALIFRPPTVMSATIGAAGLS